MKLKENTGLLKTLQTAPTEIARLLAPVILAITSSTACDIGNITETDSETTTSSTTESGTGGNAESGGSGGTGGNTGVPKEGCDFVIAKFEADPNNKAVTSAPGNTVTTCFIFGNEECIINNELIRINMSTDGIFNNQMLGDASITDEAGTSS